MKFMKLGSKPDTFYTSEGIIRSVSCEVSSDLIIQVQGIKFSLHKFPLLSKSFRLQKIYAESLDSSDNQIIQIPEFPGGPEAFELCAKFCYGITVTLSAYNLVSSWCAAEYLQMTEDVEKGNLLHKIHVFFNSCILNGFKDSILTLQTTKVFSSLSEDLGITSKCIEAISSKVIEKPPRWAEEVAELSIDLYWRTMIGIKSGGKISSKNIGEALQIYASRWFSTRNSNHRLVLEAIVSLLPSEKGTVSCSFLLKLLKAGSKLGFSSSSKMELVRRAGNQLDEANVKDLLIPFGLDQVNGKTKYDVDIVMSILDQFMCQGMSPPMSPLKIKGRFDKRRRSKSAENIELMFDESRRSSSSASHSSKMRVAKLIDGYLEEIANDVNLPLVKLISIAESIPSFARVDHDHLYFAIETYLKVHPNLSKSERKHLCRLLDCKKLSIEACMEAAKNELLPLRVLVQVLFQEQSRNAAMTSDKFPELPANIKALLATRDDSSVSSLQPAEDQWSVSGIKSISKMNISTPKIKLDSDGVVKASKIKANDSGSTRPKRMFSKLLSMNKGANEKH